MWSKFNKNYQLHFGKGKKYRAISCPHNLTTIVGAQRIQNAATEKCTQACVHDNSHILLSKRWKHNVIHLNILGLFRLLTFKWILVSRKKYVLTYSSYNSLKENLEDSDTDRSHKHTASCMSMQWNAIILQSCCLGNFFPTTSDTNNTNNSQKRSSIPHGFNVFVHVTLNQIISNHLAANERCRLKESHQPKHIIQRILPLP